MPTSAVPLVVDALVAQSGQALDAAGITCRVYDGYDSTNEPGNYLIVGAEDADHDFSEAATTTQDWATTGLDRQRDERGDITCAAVAWTGDDDMSAVRAQAYAITEVVAQLCRDNYSLGIPQLLWVSFGTRTAMTQHVNSDGELLVIVTFQVHFEARL